VGSNKVELDSGQKEIGGGMMQRNGGPGIVSTKESQRIQTQVSGNRKLLTHACGVALNGRNHVRKIKGASKTKRETWPPHGPRGGNGMRTREGEDGYND